MTNEIKDAADLFAAEGEGAREILEGLKEQATDALGLVISEAPSKGDTLGRYRAFKERELPLIMRLEDPGERRAVLEDISKAHDLRVSNLQKALTAAEERAAEKAAADEHSADEPPEEVLVPERGSERHERAMRLLECPDILEKAAQNMQRLGHIGEPRTKRLAFVCAVSAMAGYTIQPSTHAQSSAGKNYLWGIVLSLVPPEMVIERSGLSAKALFRTDMELKGKILYLQEVAGSQDAEFTIRVLQSDGKLVYEATEQDADGTMRNVVHEKEGPTVVVQTTTRIHLNHENETRVFPIYIDESSAQTERIVQSILQEAEEGGVGPEEREEIIEVWHDAVRLLEPIRVIVPYARRIRVPSSQVRIRRDVTRLLDVVRVITWLHQHSRTRDQHGRIIATEEDFRTALALVEEPLMKSWQALSPAEEKVMRAIRSLPEEKRQTGFKRSDLAVEGAQPRSVQEALASLASTGYLERDGRRGSPGYTYTLVRDPAGLTLGISLEPPDDAAGEDEGTRGSRGIARNSDRAIENPSLQEDRAIARTRGGDGNGPQEEAGEPDEENTVRQRPIDLAEETIHEQGEEFFSYGEEQRAKPERIKLAELGWARRSDVTDEVIVPTGTMAGDSGDVDRDPVVRYTASFMIGSIVVLTATEIFQGEGRDLSKGEQIPPDWPADSREVHERLSRLAPILQTTKRQHPYFEGDWYPCEEPPEVREGYTHVEYWESEAGDKEGIWVFAVHEPGEPVDREEVEEDVWFSVKDQEKVVEHFLELPSGLEFFRYGPKT